MRQLVVEDDAHPIVSPLGGVERQQDRGAPPPQSDRSGMLRIQQVDLTSKSMAIRDRGHQTYPSGVGDAFRASNEAPEFHQTGAKHRDCGDQSGTPNRHQRDRPTSRTWHFIRCCGDLCGRNGL